MHFIDDLNYINYNVFVLINCKLFLKLSDIQQFFSGHFQILSECKMHTIKKTS